MKALLFLVIALSSCTLMQTEDEKKQEKAYERIKLEALSMHCTEQQFKQVHAYHSLCSSGYGYSSAYCFDRGIVMFCENVDSIAKRSVERMQ
jgi:hypothetical protein